MHTTMVTAMPADLGGRLRYLRQCAGLPPERVALEIGLTARVIGDWERGYRTPRLVYLRQLATLYGVRLSEFVDDAEVVAGEDA